MQERLGSSQNRDREEEERMSPTVDIEMARGEEAQPIVWRAARGKERRQEVSQRSAVDIAGGWNVERVSFCI
eukprot:6173198-Pleurochrysis_carterae.AAC.1